MDAYYHLYFREMFSLYQFHIPHRYRSNMYRQPLRHQYVMHILGS